jgi:hypothetical protein
MRVQKQNTVRLPHFLLDYNNMRAIGVGLILLHIGLLCQAQDNSTSTASPTTTTTPFTGCPGKDSTAHREAFFKR